MGLLTYYARLATRSLAKHWAMTALMVAAIGLGIGVCMTIVTVNYIMASDPIPEKSDRLFYVQLDGWDPNGSYDDDRPTEPPDQLTYLDAMALMEAGQAPRQIATSGAGLTLQPDRPGEKPFIASARATFADFFPMFEVPFLYGGGWTKAEDDDRALVMVLTRAANDRLFGGEDSVGRTVRSGSDLYRVVGVVDEWSPMPRFYDVTTGPFNEVEDVFIPFNLIADRGVSRSGNTNCWKPSGDGFEAFLNSECIWIQFWVELNTEAEKRDYLAFLDRYASEQKTLGRFQRPLNNQLSDVNRWLDKEEVVQEEARILLVVAILFLAVCLLNTVGLLLSKFLGRTSEIGLRRALGASRGTLFAQYTVESALIGVLGGALGVLLTWLGLKGIRALFGPLVENLVRMDWVIVVWAILLAIAASIAAGLYPTLRAVNVAPAAHLKTQ